MHGIRCSLALMFLTAAALSAHAAPLDGIWLHPVAPEILPDVRLSLSFPESSDAQETVRIWCDVNALQDLGPCPMSLTIADASGTAVRGADQVVELYQGPNRCSFDLLPADLAMGWYTATISLDYRAETPPIKVRFDLHRVSDAYLNGRIAAAEDKLAQLEAAAAADAKMTDKSDVRLRVVREVLALARDDAGAEDWHACAVKLERLERGLDAVAAGMVFAEITPPELSAAQVPQGRLSISGHRLARSDETLFPFGLKLEEPDVAGLERASRLGMTWVSVPLGPADSLNADGTPRNIDATYGSVFEAAARLNLAVLVRLQADRLSGDMLARHPGIEANGFVDVAHPDARMLFEKHCAAALPYIEHQPTVFAAEIVNTPRFHFFDERHRQMFIEYIENRYPDRIDLNRSWRSHLGDYSDITLVSDTDYGYQTRQTFQYDFQHFHRQLGVQYCNWAYDTARRYLGVMPLLATFGDDAFKKGEARHGTNVEDAFQSFDLAGCSMTLRQNHSLYGMDYPSPSAVTTLMSDMAPGKPLLVTGDAVILDAETTPQAVRGFVRTSMWEALMTGASAIALSEDSSVFRNADALDAYVSTAHDALRLAEVIAAFQDAPRHVGVLYSDSSKLLNDGDPHLESAWYGYEGASFGGFRLDYVTERQIEGGALSNLQAMIVPETPALSEAAFQRLDSFVNEGGAVARIGTPIPYNEDGRSRTDVVRNTGETVLVRGMNLPTEFLHAMDALIHRDALPVQPHAINAFGFPLEGVKTLYLEKDGEIYLYVVNLRKTTVTVHLSGNLRSGRDLIDGTPVEFPLNLESCHPMLVHMDKHVYEAEVAVLAAPVSSN